MSKAVYETNVYVSPDPSTQMDIVDMGLAYLTAHTSATVSSPSSQYAYDRIINAGGGLYFRIQIESTTAPASVWISRGRIVNGEWVEDTNIYQSNLGPGPYSGYAVLMTISCAREFLRRRTDGSAYPVRKDKVKPQCQCVLCRMYI